MKKLIPAFGYLRVSSDGQKGEDKDGLKRQLRTIEAWATAHGFTLVQVFSDEGVSGTVPHNARPAFRKILAALYADGVKTVIVEDTDRLGREAEVIHVAVGDFRRAGFTLLTAKGQNLTSTGIQDRLVFGINASLAEYVRGQLVERLRSARERARVERGRCEGRKPYGSTPEEQAIIARMRELREQGNNDSRIAEILNADGLQPRKAGQWHRYTVGQILRRSGVHAAL